MIEHRKPALLDSFFQACSIPKRLQSPSPAMPLNHGCECYLLVYLAT